MHCPFCRSNDTRVLDSRVADDGSAIRRRRSCPACEKRFTTVEQMQLVVVKRSGATEPFTREKAIAGVRKACKGRPVSEDDLACLGQKVEDTLRSEGWAEVPAHEVGLAILGPLRDLDEVMDLGGLDRYPYAHAARAGLLDALGRRAEGRAAWLRAAGLARTDAERDFFTRRAG